MMNKKRSSIFQLTKYLLILPLAILLVQCGTRVKHNWAPVPPTPWDLPLPEDQPLVVGNETIAKYPGGDAELIEFIKANLKYPEPVNGALIEGRVLVRFAIAKDGSVEDVEVVRGLDPKCDAEAIRVVQAMPKWIPAERDGETVSMHINLPISFSLLNSL